MQRLAGVLYDGPGILVVYVRPPVIALASLIFMNHFLSGFDIYAVIVAIA